MLSQGWKIAGYPQTCRLMAARTTALKKVFALWVDFDLSSGIGCCRRGYIDYLFIYGLQRARHTSRKQ